MKRVKPLKRKRKTLKKKFVEPIELPNRKIISLHGVQAECKGCKQSKKFGKLVPSVGFICESCYELSMETKSES